MMSGGPQRRNSYTPSSAQSYTITRIGREFILQTLKGTQGDRTPNGEPLWHFGASLRDKINYYKSQGHTVPDPQAAAHQTGDI
jgi:hypothetical protein